MKTKKKFGLASLCLFLFFSPILEGYSNTYLAIGSVWLGTAVAVIWLVETFFINSVKVNFPLICLIVLSSWMFSTALWSMDAYTSIDHGIRLMMVTILYLMVFDTVRSESNLRIAILAYTAGVTFVSISAFYNIVSGISYANLSNRYSASGFDPNNFGLMLSSAIPLVFYLVSCSGLIMRAISIVVVLFFSLLIISSASRAATFSLIIVLLLCLVPNRVGFRQIIGALGMCLVAFIIFLQFVDLIPDAAIARVSQGALHDSGGGRLDAWGVILRSFGDRPIFGHGAGTTFLVFGIQAHNTFFSTLFEGGLIALSVWSAFIGVSIRYGIRLFMGRASYSEAVLSVSLFPLLIAVSTLNWEYRKSLFVIFAFIAVAHSLRESGSLSRRCLI